MVSTLALLTLISALTSLMAGFTSTRTVAGRAADVLALPAFIAAWYVVGASILTGVIAFVAGGIVYSVVRYVATGN